VLYRPEAFERLTNESWDERRVRDAIREIVADAEASFDPVTLWPAHEWDSWHTPVPLKGLYVGAAGVIFALDLLRRRGLAETRIDLPCAAERALGAWRDAPDFIAGLQLPTPAAAGLFSGESGILVVAWRLSGAAELADELLTHVRQNAENPANEVMWGAPGTMLAALAMLDWTGDERWADAWRESADVLWARRQADGLWTQDLHGEAFAELGPPHGVVGNALAMLSAEGLLEPERRTALERETDAALARTAVVEDGLANWPFAQGKPSGIERWSNSPSVVRRCTRDRRFGGVLSRRGAPARRRRARLASGASRGRERPWPLSRHSGQRPRALEGVRAHGRRTLAGASEALRDARTRSGEAA
jgi:hypothetical protein